MYSPTLIYSKLSLSVSPDLIGSTPLPLSLFLSLSLHTGDQLTQLCYGGKYILNTMKIINQILELYRDSVNSGLNVKLNLWTRDGEEILLSSTWTPTQA